MCSNYFRGHSCIKINHTGMETAATFVKEWVTLRSSLLNILQSVVSGIKTKWKQLGMTAAQPQNGQRTLRCIVHRDQQLSSEPITTYCSRVQCSEGVFLEVTNHIQSGNLMTKSGFCVCEKNSTFLIILCRV